MCIRDSIETDHHKFVTQTYGGQFLWDAIGLEDRPILMMDGFAGQQVVIDFDNNRIITAHSTDRHYDYYSLIYSQLEPNTPYKPNEQSERPKCREYVNETQFVLQDC